MLNENGLIALLFNRNNYVKYNKLIKEYSLQPETWDIIKDVGAYYTANPDVEDIDASKFVVWCRPRHPTRTGPTRAAYETQIELASSQELDHSIMNRLLELNTAVEVKELCEEAMYKADTNAIERAADIVDTWREHHLMGGYDDPLAEYDLNDVFDSLTRSGGLHWRLPELNKSIGPLCAGDFVLVGKRPEVGGTTFLTSEMSFMIEQLPNDANVVIFNNEETKGKIIGRLMQSALGATVMDLAADKADALRRYTEWLDGRTVDVVHDTQLTTAKVEQVLKRKKYSLIGFNVLWKIKPAGRKLEDYQVYQRVAQWGRVMADKHAPVLGIWQADASAEGVEWLDQSQLFGSKTGVQGESDVQIMIGKSHEPGKAEERAISIVRNKIPGSSGTDPRFRHGKWVVDFEPEIGRFKGRLK